MRTITQITAAITAVVTRDGCNTVDGRGIRRGRLITRLRLFVRELPRLFSSRCDFKHGLNRHHAGVESVHAMRYMRECVGALLPCRVWLAPPRTSVISG